MGPLSACWTGRGRLSPVNEDHDFDDLLAANRGYAESFTMQEFDGVAHAGVAMVTWGDSALTAIGSSSVSEAPATVRRLIAALHVP